MSVRLEGGGDLEMPGMARGVCPKHDCEAGGGMHNETVTHLSIC